MSVDLIVQILYHHNEHGISATFFLGLLLESSMNDMSLGNIEEREKQVGTGYSSRIPRRVCLKGSGPCSKPKTTEHTLASHCTI